MPVVQPGTRFTAIAAAAGGHNLALKSDGTVVAWGDNSSGQATVPSGLSGVVAIAAGDDQSLALKSDGTVVAWGNNDYGQATVPSGLSGVVAIAAGYYHSLALKSDGTVVAWGDNDFGEATVPSGLSGVVAIAAGGYHSLALKSDGTVVAWGDNYYGEATVPSGLSGVVAIAAGFYHSLALKSDGTVMAWGNNDYGQATVPSGLSGVVAIAAGVYHSLALKSDGTVVAWGYNYYGEATVPSGLSGAVAIAAGYKYSLAIVAASAPNVLQGRITDSDGSGIDGATISATNDQTVAQVTSDANGDYGFPSLTSGAYLLIVTASGYADAARAFTFNGNTSVQNFQLTALPVAPDTQQTTRQVPPAFLQPPPGPMGSTLKVFDGTQFVPITVLNTPSADVMTIVLTHGWTRDPNCTLNSGINGWPTTLATAMRAKGITPDIANIVGWDWHDGAKFDGSYGCHAPPAEHAPSQGVALGQWLQDVLGADYSMPTHFIGHSLGTLVNAAAINYLHRDRPATIRQEIASIAWIGSIHVTLFDHAETADSISQQQWPMPVSSTWADNYVSLVGYHQSAAVNVNLQKGIFIDGPFNAHSYPMEWYTMSITNPTDVANPLGFRQSYEYRTLIGYPNPPLLPPSTIPVNSNYQQSPWNNDQLALEASAAAVNVPFGILPDAVVQKAYVNAIQIKNSVSAQVEASAMAAEQAIEQGYNYVVNIAGQDEQALVNLFNTPVLQLNLSTGPVPAGQQVHGNALQTLDVGGGSTNGPAMAWVPVQIPSNATSMAFDFIIAGDPVDDFLVFGIETNNLYSLEAKYIPTNSVSGSRLIDVSAWAGTSNEVFFGLMGGTSTNATLQIDNIRFYSLQSNLVDSVGDGIPDSWRAQYFPNVDPTGATTNNISCATCDPDGDGLNNLAELLAGTVPTNPASAFRIITVDEIGEEIRVSFTSVGSKYYCLDRCDYLGGTWSTIVDNIPGNDGAQQATDMWGANRGGAFYRVRLNESPNPTLVDSDGDGIPDAWMMQYFDHPTGQAGDKSRPGDDADGDGVSNLKEYLAGTDPTNSASAFRILSLAQESNNIRVTWFTAGGHTNAVQSASGLGGIYSDMIPSIVVTGGSAITTNYLDVGGATNRPARFYRIRLVP